MKHCPSCDIKIEGNHAHCPLCQNALLGEGEVDIYPSRQELRKKSLIYKIQLFVLVTIMIVSLALEFLLDFTISFHWSLLVAVWVVGGELWIDSLIKHHSNPSRIITTCGWWVAFLVMCTFLIINIRPIYFLWVMPGIAILAEILHFICMMTDRGQNAMAHLLGSSLVCILIGTIPIIITGEKNILWVVNLLVGVIAIVGAVIFKGRNVTLELEKRLHI